MPHVVFQYLIRFIMSTFGNIKENFNYCNAYFTQIYFYIPPPHDHRSLKFVETKHRLDNWSGSQREPKLPLFFKPLKYYHITNSSDIFCCVHCFSPQEASQKTLSKCCIRNQTCVLCAFTSRKCFRHPKFTYALYFEHFFCTWCKDTHKHTHTHWKS